MKYLSNKILSQRGATAVLVALIMVVLLGIVALAVDVGYVMVTRNDLQNIADAGALAGTGELGHQYKEAAPGLPLTGLIANEIQQVANQNIAGNRSISIGASDIHLGQWDGSTNTFTSTLVDPNAVRVIARRDDVLNGPVGTFFARVFGRNDVSVRAFATAALTPLGTSSEVQLPVAISEAWFDPKNWEEAGKGFCDQPIKFYPTGDLEGCAGWDTFDENANADNLGDILNGIEDGTYQVPGVTTDETPSTGNINELNFTGGNVASRFPDMQSLFDSRKGDPVLDEFGNQIPLYYDEVKDALVDPRDYSPGTDFSPYTPITDRDGNQKYLYEWKTTVPVYAPPPDKDGCSNPTGSLQVVGFATVVVMAVNGSGETPQHRIFAKITCGEKVPGRGGGADFGTVGTIPGLVEPPLESASEAPY